MLQAIDLTKRYEDGVLALDHLNLTVKEGGIFCLLVGIVVFGVKISRR